MKTLYESILDIDTNINKANVSIDNIGKVKSIMSNLVDELIDSKFDWTCQKCKYELVNGHNHLEVELCLGNIFNKNIDILYDQLYKHIDSVFNKYKSSLKSFKKFLNVQKDMTMSFESIPNSSTPGRIYNGLYRKKSIGHEYVFSVLLKEYGTLRLFLGNLYINDVKNILLRKNIHGNEIKNL